MNKEILVSVVVPCYNIEKYVEKCVDSILSQTYKNLEIILVDDGSTDNTGKILDGYKDKRIKVVHQKNSGLSAARNSGLKIAKGEYICFVDGDDYITSDYVRAMEEKAEKSNSDIVICGYKEVDEKGKNLKEVIYGRQKELSGKEAVVDYLHYIDVVSVVAWNKLYKTNLFKKNGIEYPIARLYEDTYTTYKLFYFAKKISYIDDLLYFYVQRNGSITAERFSENRFKNIIYAVDETKNFFHESGEDKNLESDLKTFEINELSFALYSAVINKIYCSERKKVIIRLKNLRKDINSLSCVSKTAKVLAPFLALLSGRIFYKIIRYIATLFVRAFYVSETIFSSLFTRKKVFILNTPIHGNLGDQAILNVEKKLIRDVLRSYKIIEVSNDFCFYFSWLLKPLVRKSPVCIHGGGYLGDLWPKEDKIVRKLLIKFKNNKVLFFPQTICSENIKGYFHSAKSIFELNKNLYMFGRDKYTYDTLSENLNANIYYSPDIVLYDDFKEYKKKDKILLCLRHDHEKTMNIDTESRLLFAVKKYNYEISDTVIDKTIFNYNRKRYLNEIFEKIGESKLLVTDRLHGMVFAYLTKTPCLVFNSKSPKVKGVYDWIKNSDYIFLHNENKDISEEIGEILSRKNKFNESVSEKDFIEMKSVLLEISK